MPLALPRRGVGHDGGAAEGFASASHIRELLINGACADEFLTPESAAICARECAAGRAPVTMANAERAILARLRAMREEDFAPFDGGGEGLYHRFYDAVQRETTIDGILAAAKSKRYAYARLRRLLLAAYLGVTPEDIPQRVPYLRVLACNARGREVLRCMKTTAAAPVLTRSADVRRLDADAQRLFALTARAEEQYVLGLSVPCRGEARQRVDDRPGHSVTAPLFQKGDTRMRKLLCHPADALALAVADRLRRQGDPDKPDEPVHRRAGAVFTAAHPHPGSRPTRPTTARCC